MLTMKQRRWNADSPWSSAEIRQTESRKGRLLMMPSRGGPYIRFQLRVLSLQQQDDVPSERLQFPRHRLLEQCDELNYFFPPSRLYSCRDIFTILTSLRFLDQVSCKVIIPRVSVFFLLLLGLRHVRIRVQPFSLPPPSRSLCSAFRLFFICPAPAAASTPQVIISDSSQSLKLKLMSMRLSRHLSRQ